MTRFISLLLLCAISTIGFAQQSYISLPDDPTNTREYTLDNGLKVYLSVNKDEPRIQTSIAVRAGSKNDPSTNTGLAHYLEHMLFKGTSKIGTKDWEGEKKKLEEISKLYENHKDESDPEKKKEIYREIDKASNSAAKYAIANEYDKMATTLGATGTNAYTSNERTVYINNIPSNEIERWLMLESERFSELVLRLFHTELEAVYEEYNRSLDSDFRKVYFKVFEELFKNHPYGTQTTIGTSEHLKNPSMVAIHEYFDTYYVPNNMAICMSGDFDPDVVIKQIEKYFGGWNKKEVPEFRFDGENDLKSQSFEVYGKENSSVSLGFRLNGVDSKEATTLRVLDIMMSNGSAGFIDLNLKTKQKVQTAYSYPIVYKDYSVFMMTGVPKQDQSLDEVEQLLMDQLELIASGDYDKSLLEAAKKELRINHIQAQSQNRSRVNKMVDLFIFEQPLDKMVRKSTFINQITAQDVEALAKDKLLKSHITVKKIQKDDVKVEKVDKPEITPIELDKESESAFMQKFNTIEPPRINPVFVDHKSKIGSRVLMNGSQLSVIKNEENELFSLSYIWNMGSHNNLNFGLAFRYLDYLGTDKYNASEFKTELYKAGLRLSYYTANDKMYLTLTGLEESLNKGVDLVEHMLTNVVADKDAYENLVNSIMKGREDAKTKKHNILRNGMANYAKYGKDNPYTYRETEEELRSTDPEMLIKIIKDLKNYPHEFFYYGKKGEEDIERTLNIKHTAGLTSKTTPAKKEFVQLETTEDKVYFVDYDMVQAEMLFVSKSVAYNPKERAVASVFNQYFGRGLSSIIFQEIRESKALAYSAFCNYSTPGKKGKAHYTTAYIGTQADKLSEATDAMLTLLRDMPKVEKQFEQAKLAALKKMETNRVTKQAIYWDYKSQLKRGHETNIDKQIYEAIKTLTLADLDAFFKKRVATNKYNYLIIGKKDNLDMEVLKKLGSVEELSLETIFGY